MKKPLLAAAVACGVVGLIAASPAASAPKGNAYGYWAGRLCDHVGPTTNGVTYWEDRYGDRSTCIELEGASLRRGEWDPDTLDPVLYPI
jgi:hypothetical protein